MQHPKRLRSWKVPENFHNKTDHVTRKKNDSNPEKSFEIWPREVSLLDKIAFCQ